MTTAGKRLIKAALEARAIARGDIKPARMYIPAEMDVKAIRGKLKATQDDFASEFGFSVSQIRDWEQNRSRPLDGTRAYLMLIDSNPDVVRELLQSARKESLKAREDLPLETKAM